MGKENEPELTDEIGGLESITLDEAISILGEQTRMEIIVELGKAWDQERHQQQALGFSELMNSVGIADSGRFNYHLDKLVGTFITKIEEGYLLLNPGRRFFQMLMAGTLTERKNNISTVVGDCPACSGNVRATYRGDNILMFKCADCEAGYGGIPFSPGGFESRTVEEAIQAAYRSMHSELRLARQSVCPVCGGKIQTRIIEEPSKKLTSFIRGSVLASMKCKICNDYYFSDLSNIALTTEEAERFVSDHDRDAALVQDWDEVMITADETQTILQEDPLQVKLTLAMDDEELNLIFDADLQVVDSERTTRD